MRISDWSSDVCSSDLLVVAWGVSDTLMPAYSSAGDVQRVTKEITDPDTGMHVLAQSEPELQQLIAALERARTLQTALHQRHQQIGRASCRERVCQYV